MSLLGPFTHVIFDLDGVLLDTEPLYTRAAEQVVSQWGKVYDWRLKADLMGRAPLDGARRVVQALGLPITAEEYLLRRGRILEQLVRQAPALDGAPELVTELARLGIPLGVATSSERRLFDLKRRPHPWFDLIRVVVCGDDPEVCHYKPAPDIFLMVARRLGADPARCLVFEDSPAGLSAAQGAGMRVVARVDPNLEPGLFSAANLVIRRYCELEIRPWTGSGSAQPAIGIALRAREG